MLGSGRFECPAKIVIHMFGNFSLQDAESKPIRVANRKACGLLAYLALTENSTETRERLAGLLWSERAEHQARASLRQCLKQLRTVFDGLGILAFKAERSQVQLEPDRVNTDVWEVVSAAERGEAHAHLLDRKRLTETLLSGLEEVDPEFRMWLLVQRQNLHERLVRALEDAARAAERKSDLQALRRLSEALINLDPTHEEACRHLMQAFAALGDMSGALRTYKTLWDELDEEYDMEPSDQTQDLVVAIKMGEHGPQASPGADAREGFAELPAVAGMVVQPAGTSPVSATHSLALVIEEFTASGVPESSAHICEGFRHDLISRLVRFREWAVIDGGSTPGADLSAEDGAVRYRVKVKFYQDHDTLNLILTVQAGDTGVYVWSDRFGVSLDRFFESQRQVMRRISAALNIHISMERLNRISHIPDVRLDIYDRWLLGQSLGARWRPENDERAEQIFRSIIEEAPQFAPAYASLAGILNSRHHTFPGVRRSKARDAEALRVARRAVENDPLDTRSQLCLAWSHAMSAQHDNAAFHFTMAHDLNTSDAWTLVSGALGMAYCSDTETAMKYAREALQLGAANSPSHWAYHANVRFICGDYDGCIEAANAAQDTIFYVPGWKAAALALLGQTSEAHNEGERFFRLISKNWYGDEEATPAAIADWFLEAFPIRRRESRERLQAGYMAASAPLFDGHA